MSKQVLIIRQYVARDQRQLAEQMSAQVKYYKNLFHLAFVLLKDMNFMEAIGHVRYINIPTWLRGFRVKIVNFLSFFRLSIPKRDLDT